MKAAFFDIDGTLKPFNEIELRDTTIAMLHALQEKGIKVFLASGRPPVQLPLLGKKLNAFPWDGIVFINCRFVRKRCILWFHGSKRMRIMLVHSWKKMILMILHLIKHIMNI